MTEALAEGPCTEDMTCEVLRGPLMTAGRLTALTAQGPETRDSLEEKICVFVCVYGDRYLCANFYRMEEEKK